MTMISPVSSLLPVTAVTPLEMNEAAPAASGAGAAFRSALDAAIDSVSMTQTTAATAVSDFLEGKGGELHSAILSTQRAELQFELFLQVRNKVVSAYQEVMRVQV
jgi:flagellar hook-basal body complex protein FliE